MNTIEQIMKRLEVIEDILNIKSEENIVDNVSTSRGKISLHNLITGEELVQRVGLDPTNLQFSDEPWLKFSLNGEELLIAKNTYLHSISMDELLKHNLVYGDRTISIDNDEYIIRLLTDEEWEQTLVHVHELGIYDDKDMLTHYNYGKGALSWLQESNEDGYFKVRGYFGVSFFNFNISSYSDAHNGWRPVLVKKK